MNTVIEIIITLSFVFLIYSLLTTVLVEIYTATFRLRARNLRFTIRRMLQDETIVSVTNRSLKQTFLNLFKRHRKERAFVQLFFEHPTIKYLGKNTVNKSPSYIDAKDFSKTLYEILTSDGGFNDTDKIENALDYEDDFDQKMSFSESDWKKFITEIKKADEKDVYIRNWLDTFKNKKIVERIEFNEINLNQIEQKLAKAKTTEEKMALLESWKKSRENKAEIEPETLYRLKGLYKASKGDTEQFKLRIENWFNNTMNRSRGWFKQRIAKVTFVIGFLVAFAFNVDAIFIAKELKENTALREEMIDKIAKNYESDTTMQKYVDSLKTNVRDINNSLSLQDYDNIRINKNDWFRENKRKAIFFSILGWGLTGIAISFGAPFWFDILNKFMKLRTSGKTEGGDGKPEIKTNTEPATVSNEIQNRKG